MILFNPNLIAIYILNLLINIFSIYYNQNYLK